MPCKHLQARSVLHYQLPNPLDSQKSTVTINAYISIKLTKSQDKTSNYHSLNLNLIENSDPSYAVSV